MAGLGHAMVETIGVAHWTRRIIYQNFVGGQHSLGLRFGRGWFCGRRKACSSSYRGNRIFGHRRLLALGRGEIQRAMASQTRWMLSAMLALGALFSTVNLLAQ